MELTNRKWHYRFIEFVINNLGFYIPHERAKQIIFDNFQAETEVEFEILRMKKAYFYILGCFNQILTVDVVNEIYYLLNGIELEDDISYLIIKKYYEEINVGSLLHAAKFHIFILDNITLRKEQFAFLMTNYLLLRRERKFVCLRKGMYNQYKKIIEKDSEHQLKLLFSMIVHSDKKEITKSKIKKIKKKIKRKKKDIKRIFQVEHLYIYGSYSKARTHNTSDLDLLLDKDDICLETLRQLKEYIGEIVDIKIDIIRFGTAIKHMDHKEMEYLVKIF